MANTREVVVTQQKMARNKPTAKGLGITTGRPKFPQYALMANRDASYVEQDWPTDCPVTVDKLVEAGLVFTGVGDSVRCYYCGGGLRNWEDGDDPMVEHARWYPNCQHVLISKGKKFVDAIANGEDPDEGLGMMSPHTPEEDDLDSPATIALKDMGYDKDIILKAVNIYKQKNGNADYSGTDLCKIIFDIEEQALAPEAVPAKTVAAPSTDVADTKRSSPDGASADQGYGSMDSEPENDEDKDDVCKDRIEDLLEENERLKGMNTCKICLDKQADVIFMPCGHMVSCAQCAPAMDKCPICRKEVLGMVKAFFATFNKHVTSKS